MENIAALASALNVVPPSSWPPPLHDAGSRAWYLDLLQQDGAVGFRLWYLVVPLNERQLAGTVGFKGKPRDSSCEIAFSLLPEFEGFGYATEAAQRLDRMGIRRPTGRTTHSGNATRPRTIDPRHEEMRDAIRWQGYARG
jgi:RimJ/RimL family protein N-acetyltransferase